MKERQHVKHCAFLVVYSLADSESFENARQILAALPFNAPKYLAANQLDLEHRRQVEIHNLFGTVSNCLKKSPVSNSFFIVIT